MVADTPAPASSTSQPGDLQPPGARSGPVRRWRWLLPSALLLVWLGIGSLSGSYQLSDVQKTDSSSYLPSSAESSRVATLQRSFATARSYPATILVAGDRKLTADQLARMRSFVASIPGLEIGVDGEAPVKVGDYLTSSRAQVVPSDDGRAALAVVNFDLTKLGTRLADGENVAQQAIETVRAAARPLASDGTQVYVAGPAAQIADLVKAFGGIDGILLLVALGTVLAILLVVYRSPIVPLLVLFSAGSAYVLATMVVYLLAKNEVITLDGQAQGILSILVIGAATDYSLLLVARYREELRRHDDRYEAMWLAWRRTLEPVAASAGTVILALLCLLLSQLGSTRGLGPVGAIGIASALLASLTFLPAVLVLPGRNSPGEHGRWVFWPRIPRLGSEKPETAGIWGRVSRLVGAYPRRIWALTALVLLALAAFVPTLKAEGVSQSDTFLSEVESVTGARELARHFPSDSGSPVIVIAAADTVDAVVATLESSPGVKSVMAAPGQPAGMPSAIAPAVVDGRVQIQASLSDPADSSAAIATVRQLRTALDEVSPDVLVGGASATSLDLRSASTQDRNRIIPVILAVIFVVLAGLLRSLVAPLVLLVANVLSFAATLGTSALVFNHVFDFPGADTAMPLFGFVFLVALGIDYSIFLMVRVREESVREGTRPGIRSGLAVTGGVITSAGVVLAATFAALGVIPLLFLAQTAFIVAFGVLLDTMVVRSLLVPALSHDIGRRIWLPGSLARAREPVAPPTDG